MLSARRGEVGILRSPGDQRQTARGLFVGACRGPLMRSIAEQAVSSHPTQKPTGDDDSLFSRGRKCMTQPSRRVQTFNAMDPITRMIKTY